MTTKLQVIAVYDAKARAFLPPVFVPTVEVGERMLAQALRDPSHNFAMWPDDYSLSHFGEFDIDVGVFTLFEVPRDLGQLSRLRVVPRRGVAEDPTSHMVPE